MPLQTHTFKSQLVYPFSSDSKSANTFIEFENNMSETKPTDSEPIGSPTIDSAVARLDEASYQDGIQERQAILEAQAIEGAKDESVWQAENEGQQYLSIHIMF
jgi:hypothetical protein